MNFSKKLLLALTLLASHSARADYWSDLVKWAGKARQSGLLAPIGLLPSPCTDKRTIHGEEYAICPGSNFVGKNLTRADLRGANLTRANLTSANLSHANLTGANLEGAILKGAIFTTINLTGAKLSGANLENAILHNADLSKADLSNANLSGANLEGAQLNNAILTNANLSGAKLKEADLVNAALRGANLSQADITNTNFQAADLTDCKIDGITHFAGARGNVYRGTTFVDIQNVIRPIATPVYPSAYHAFRKPFSLREEETSEIEVENGQPERVKTSAPRSTSPAASQSPQQQLMQPVLPPAQGQLQPIAPGATPATMQMQTAPFVGMQPVEPTPRNALRAQLPIWTPATQPNADASSPGQQPIPLREKIIAAIKNPTRPTTSSPNNPPAEIKEIQKHPEITAPEPTTQSPLPTRSPELVSKDKEEADEQPKPVAVAAAKQKEENPEKPVAIIEQSKALESTLIKRYLTKVDLLFTPDVKLNNNYIAKINELGEMLQHYPALLRIHAKYVARPAEEFYKHLPKAEAGLRHKKYTESKLTELLDDLFKKIRTTLWAQDDMNKWVARIITLTFDTEEKSHKYIRRDAEDKNSLINAIKQSFTTQLKKTVRPLMNAQAPIAQLYAYFDEINNQLNAITFRDATIGPMINLHNSLLAAVYEKDKKLKPEFAPFKTTIDKLLVQMDKKVALPNAENMESRYATIEEVRKAFFKIRESMNREYEKRGKP